MVPMLLLYADVHRFMLSNISEARTGTRMFEGFLQIGQGDSSWS